MMPCWLFTLGRYITAGSPIAFPFTNILISLVTLIVPCAAGIILKHFKPNVEEKAKKIIKPISLLLIAVLISFGTYANLYIFSLMTWKTILSGMLLPWSGFTVGFLVATVMRLGFENALTISIETGIQNSGVAVIIVSFSLAHPDSDLTLVMPVCVTLFTPIPLIICLIIKSIWKCIRARKTIKISPAMEKGLEKEKKSKKKQIDNEISLNSNEMKIKY